MNAMNTIHDGCYGVLRDAESEDENRFLLLAGSSEDGKYYPTRTDDGQQLWSSLEDLKGLHKMLGVVIEREEQGRGEEPYPT